MGFNVQQFIDDVDDNLLCGICAGVLEKAVVTTCGHSYCEQCLDTWLQRRIFTEGTASCPACRSNLFMSDHVPVVALRGVIDGLIVHCPNSESGCKMVIRLDYISSHLKACRYELVQCFACKKDIPRAQLASHHANCSTAKRISCISLKSEQISQNASVEDLSKQLAIVESDLRKTKDALNLSQGNVKKLERELREMRYRMDQHSSEEEDEFDSDFDPEYNYGYSPQSIVQLSNMISRSLHTKPYYVDRGFTFSAVKRCFDFYHNFPGYSQDVHMMLATAYASNWFTETQKQTFEIWLESITKERYIR